MHFGVTHARTVLGALGIDIIPTPGILVFLVSVLYHRAVAILHIHAQAAAAIHQGIGIIPSTLMFRASADGLMSLPRQQGSVGPANVDAIPVNHASVQQVTHSQGCQVRA